MPEPTLIPPDGPAHTADCDVCRGHDWLAVDGKWKCEDCNTIYSRDGILLEYGEPDGVCMNCGGEMDFNPMHPWCDECDEKEPHD